MGLAKSIETLRSGRRTLDSAREDILAILDAVYQLGRNVSPVTPHGERRELLYQVTARHIAELDDAVDVLNIELDSYRISEEEE
jgi:predicted CoA-binding protein